MSAVTPTEYEARIRELEQVNEAMATEINRMRPVVEAAVSWRHRDQDKLFLDAVKRCDRLNDAIDVYEASQPK